ncbi:MAG TPA: mannose-1-phosphate guanylyltransferase/mannose-6-phosphate isomerase [Gammaproteobacteria bacterium]|nr:mannose-1-phosphate guanylyltransferase/mannose-6-phosphate isomerase [Gammaproteobacteria bacterium]
MVPVILSGGSGTRLWPYSRSAYPKQFLPLVSERTMLQETVLRFNESDTPIVVCNEEHRFMVAEQLRSIDVQANSIILEPVGRNTAPAIALAALRVLQKEDQLLIVLPADHIIPDLDAFLAAVSTAESAAMQGDLVTFGVVPTYAETGYGYLKAGDARVGSSEVFSVDQFLEKPNVKNASKYIECGDYFWNSGMFLFKASRYIEELQKHAPEMVAACRAALELATDDLDFVRVDKSSFEACPSDSIDYAVMEKTDRAVMVPLDAGWNDVGSWASLWSASEKDENGNSIKGDVIAEDTTDCYIQGESKLIATVGLESVVVVQTDDTILVATKDKVHNVKQIVERLKQMDRPETMFHRKVFRPWGYYDSIDYGERFQVKRLMVKPGAKLSVQMHHHRAEHWVVVSGTAEVRNGDNIMMLNENESTYIPIGVTHSLANPGTLPLEIIEVQSGSYLGEDDIVRFEDVYGRMPG